MLRILIVKTTSMGDVIHALPVLDDIKRFSPEAEIDWMVEEPFADLVRANSRVRRVIPIALRQWRKKGWRFVAAKWRELADELAATQYDWVIDLQGLLKSALMARAAQGKRAGPGLGYARESLACFFYQERAGWDPQAHAVERLRELCASLLGYRLQGPPVFYFDRFKNELQSPEGKEIWFLHATARAEKRWPVVSWRELAHRFSDMGYHIKLPWGTKKEHEQANAIAKSIDYVEVMDYMPLGPLSEKLKNARLVVGVDTGLLHLAAAYYLPMVSLFFATPAWRFAPRFNPRAISIGDLGVVPSAGEVYEAGSRLLRGNKV